MLKRIKYYGYLHLCILVFSMTEIFGKFAAITYKQQGLYNAKFWVFLFLMLFVCVFYALCWQQVIKHFDLHTAYANRAMYLVWSQIWASVVFSEVITPKNILGMLIVMTGVILVSTGDADIDDQSSAKEVA